MRAVMRCVNINFRTFGSSEPYSIWTNVVFNSDEMIRVGLFHCVVLCCMGNFADFTKTAAKLTHGVMEDISPFPHFSYFGNFEICYVLCKSALN